MDALLTVAVVVLVILAAVIVVQRVKYKNLVLQTEQSKKDLIEKEAILQKEAMIKAKEALHIEREQLNEDERERRREFAAIENKLSKRGAVFIYSLKASPPIVLINSSGSLP